MRVLAEDRTPLGVMPTGQALAEARALGVDMILVSAGQLASDLLACWA